MKNKKITIYATTTCSFCSINDELIANLNDKITSILNGITDRFDINCISISGKGDLNAVISFTTNNMDINTLKIKNALEHKRFRSITIEENTSND